MEAHGYLVPLSISIPIATVTFGLLWYCQKKNHAKPNSDKSKPRKSGWKISSDLNLSEVGVNFNQWRKPVSRWGPDEDDMKSLYTQLDINESDWKHATSTVDSVLHMLLCQMKKRLNKDVIIKEYIKQGSSREGLKVGKADEFDVLMLFHINDLPLETEHLTDAYNNMLPEFGRLVVADDIDPERYKWFFKNECIEWDDSLDKFCLNSRKLHEKLFISLIQSASHDIQVTVNDSNKDLYKFTLNRIRKNPPAVNIEIEIIFPRNIEENHVIQSLKEVKDRHYRSVLESANRDLPKICRRVINVDIVPAIQIGMEKVPDPTDWNKTMECPRYAVFRWVETNQAAAGKYACPPELRWRLCSSGYEKHVIDVARGSTEQSYILTALRILKWKFTSLQETWEPPQLVAHVRSYHLKHIAFYCILYLTVLNKVHLTGVKQALAYLLDFLSIALTERRLPHFFHDNEFIVYMFPDYNVADNTLRYDLFIDKTDDCLLQAKMSFKRLKLREEMCDNVFTYPEYANTFQKYIQAGKYYTGNYCRAYEH
ncbi:uncharacterized protein LOC132746799 isoform X2 [Ruditapes philippinarum]|uniref:uncharacterized protein LOC132746799 isoform X2 n=1 Tax=Ruditapes philippinarum TaxID=129788 RepID=UPI00295B2695|nr:uncharacterized protein LOC132746799 isoform X2 [Ruditapes philippinarum]